MPESSYRLFCPPNPSSERERLYRNCRPVRKVRCTVLVMKCSGILLLSTIVASMICPGLVAQQNAPPTVGELLRILRVTTFRVRTPAHPDEVWDIKVLPRDQVKVSGAEPKGLTKLNGLLSLRDMGHDVYEFTLPERNGAYSQGEFELCREISCSGQYSIHWLKRPIYSADGTQCLLGKFSNLGDAEPTAYIALVRVGNKP